MVYSDLINLCIHNDLTGILTKRSKKLMFDEHATSSYLTDTPTISYVEPDAPWLTQKLITSIEVLFGRKKVEAIYHELKSRPFDVSTFFKEALDQGNISQNYSHAQFGKIPKTGPLLFVANHPFGIIDGLTLCDLAIKARQDFRILLHSRLCQDKDLAKHFLPIDFNNTKTALKTNISSKRKAQDCLRQNIPVLIFPSGMVSTADKFGLGHAKDSPWTTFAAKLVMETEATVVPVYFHGQNSRKFQIMSHIAEPLRMALLVHEAFNKFNSTLTIDIGDPVEWQEMSQISGRKALTDFLYDKVQSARCTDSFSSHLK